MGQIAPMPRLLLQRHFGPFFVTQFLGAFNDNFYKTAMLLLIVYRLRPDDPQAAAVLAQMAAAIFILPFFLFSLWAGVLADRHDKAAMIRLIKGAEIFIMVIGVWGLMTGHIGLLFAALFAMGTHSAFFGPIKYAILPQHVPPDQLVAATAWVEAGTFLAILSGQLAAGLLDPTYIMGAVLAVALLGFISARYIPPAPAPVRLPGMAQPGWQDVRLFLAQADMRIPIVRISLFWALGLVITTQLPPLVQAWLLAPQQVVTAYLAIFSIGVAAGSLGAMLLRTRVCPEKMVQCAACAIGLGLLLLYLMLLTIDPVAGTDMRAARLLWWPVGGVLAVLSVAAGVYVVPLYVRLQQVPPAHLRAQLLGVNNLTNAAFMVFASLMAAGAQALGVKAAAVLLGAAFVWMVFHALSCQKTDAK